MALPAPSPAPRRALGTRLQLGDEAAARILKRDTGDVPATAGQLRLRPQDLVDLGIAEGITG